MMFIIEFPGFLLHIEGLRNAFDRAGRLPLAARLVLFGKQIFYLNFFISDKWLYQVDLKWP